MKPLQDPVGLGMAWSDSLVVNIELLQEGVEVDLTKLRSIVRHNFSHIQRCGENFHDSCLDAFSALGVYRFSPRVLGG